MARITAASSRREFWRVALVGISASLVYFMMYMSGLDGLRVPLAYRGDALSYLNQIDNMIPRGWYWRSPEMAYPFGQDQSQIAQADLLPYSIMWLLSRLLEDQGRVFNTFILLSCGTNASGAYWAARRLACTRPTALVVAFGFAFSYYHWFHSGSHLALGWSPLVPVWMALGLVWARHEMLLKPAPEAQACSRASLELIAVTFLQSLSGVYYSAFLLVTIVSLAGTVTLATRRIGPLVVAIRAAAVVAVGFLVQAALQVAARGDFSLPRQILPRSLDDIEYYSLQPVHLLLPADGYPVVRVAAAAARRIPESLRGEGGKYLGLAAILGLITIVARATLRPISDDLLARRQAARLYLVVAMALLAAALPGGGAYLLGLAGLLELRVWSRVALPMSLIGLLGLASAIDVVFTRSRRRSWHCGAALALVAVGVWEVSGQPPAAADAVARWRDDRIAISLMREALPGGAAVLQLPNVPYPEMEPVLEFADYEHFRPALHSDDFCWSYGALRGSGGLGLGINDLLLDRRFTERARAEGFAAVWVDLRALTDDQQETLNTVMRGSGNWIRPREDIVVQLIDVRMGGCRSTP